MSVTCKRWLLAAVVGAALLVIATPASAQVMPSPYNRPYGPYSNPISPAYNQTNPGMYSGAAANPYAGTASLNTAPGGGYAQFPGGDSWNNPWMSNPYGSSYWSPWGSALSGAADLVTAQGNYLISYQRANLLQQEFHRSMLDTRRKTWEEARYERASLMNSEQARVANIQSALERARNNPPLPEIWSAQSLNSLFDFLAAQQGKVGDGPAIPINEDVLKHINLTTGKNGNIGLLRRGIPEWPVPLQRSEFKETHEKLKYQLQDAISQATNAGKVNLDLASDVRTNVARMQEILLQHVSDFQPTDYLTAKKFLNMLEDSAKALSDPNVANYFNDGKWTAKGKNIADLVNNMKGTGQRFAPAAPGDAWAYTALYNAMRDYDAGMTRLISSQQQPKQP